MVDSCTIGPPMSRHFDPDSRQYFNTALDAVYTGKCKVQRPERPVDRDVGGDDPGVADIEVHVPMSATGIERNHVVTVVLAALDVELIGRRFRVESVPAKSMSTARRLPCVEVTS